MARAHQTQSASAASQAARPSRRLPTEAAAHAGGEGSNASDAALSPLVPLLATKLFIPRPRPDLVARPRLLAQLETGLRGPVTLLAAPAGWGKTTMIASWCVSADRPRTRTIAWVSLDAGDNDPVRFWTYVLTALEQARPGVAEDALTLLRGSQPPAAIEAALTVLLNAVAGLSTNMVLVLDDYHLITAAAVHTSLTYLLEHQPPRLHLVLASREDPPLSLARLRASGALCELRAADLRFTSEEVSTFLTEMAGLPLDTDSLEALEARTEGWIAGLQLAALSVQGRSGERARAFLAGFTGSNRYILDYLVEEVLARQPPAIQTFLLRTAVVDRFCAPLCEELLADPKDGEILQHGAQEQIPPPAAVPGVMADRRIDTAGAAGAAGVARASGATSPTIHALLEQVERANLFLIPLDDERHWYRYHHLFAEVLRSRLRQQDHTLAAELHQRASGWFEGHGHVVEAIQQALAAPDVTRAAELVEQHGHDFGLAGQVATVLGWIRALPEAVVRTRPQLGACHAAMLFLSGQAESAAVEARLHDLEAAVAARRQAGADEAELRPLLGMLASVRALVAILPGDLERSVALARDALELLPETEASWRLGAFYMLQQTFEVTGDVAGASIGEWSRRAATWRARGLLDMAVTLGMDLAHRQRLQGQLRAAAASYADVMPTLPEPLHLKDLQFEDLLPGAGAGCVFGLAHLQLEWNDLAGADQLLTRGMRILQRRVVPARGVTLGYVTLARLQQARGEEAAALETLDAFEALAERRHFAAVWPARAAAVRAQIQLAQGDLAAATRWAEASGLSLSPDDPALEFLHEREYLTLVRVRIAQGQGHGDPSGPSLGEALHLLDRVQQDAEPKERLSSVLEVLVLRALAFQARRDMRGAVRTLVQALEMAQPEGYVRLFADEDTPMATLLSELLDAAEQRRVAIPAAVLGYAQFLLAVCRARDGGRTLCEPVPEGTDTDSVLAPTPRVPALAPGVPPLLDPLTERELEVLRLLAEGASNAAIAAKLVVAVGTVKKHVYNICSKLGAQNRTQAIARARALRLL